MSGNAVFFDATKPDYPFGIAGFAIGVVLILVAIVMLRSKSPGRGDDRTANRAMGAAPLLFGLVVLVVTAWPGINALRAQSILRSGSAEVVEGCVEHYSNERVGRTVDTHFSIRNVPFNFNSGGLFPGFHEAPDKIRQGEALKIIKSKEFIIKIETSARACD